MNVFLPKQLLLCLLLMASIHLWGQNSTKTLSTSSGQTIRDTFESAAGIPILTTNILNYGTARLSKVSTTKYELIYTANSNVVGTETLRIQRFTCSFCTGFITYTINVRENRIVANQDYTFTAENTPISINATGNDTSSDGVRKITAIPLTNNGTATISGNTIQFTPTPDFEGIAYINYVICNSNGLCDNGTITVQVLGANANKSDTLRVFTKKNNAQVILIPNTFQVSTNPANGSYSTNGDAPKYTPNQDFAGTDYIRLNKGSVTKTVEVVVLDAATNILAFDDEAFTTPAEPVEVNVLENDLYKEASGCFSIQDQPQYGRIEEEGGLVTYYPSADFNGVDWFTYSVNAPGCTNQAEVATAYIYVGNFEPAATKYRMYTPKNTPLAIDNDVPVSNFKYKINDQGDLGTVVILESGQDTLILGQTIIGDNTILYIPNLNVTSGLDEFEVSYCVFDADNQCSYEKSIKIEVQILDINVPLTERCTRDCIWAGDTNLDGIVDIKDILPLGIGMGSVGPIRTVATAAWYGQRGNDWAANASLNVNAKHLDTDGSGVVTASDTVAINTYYGNTHGLNSVRPVFYKYDIALGGDVEVIPGDLVELDLVMGSEENPAVDVYGFVFPFEYNPLVFDPASIAIDLSGSNWFGYNSPILSMSKNNQEGLIEAAITRTTGVAASGIGEIGKVKFVVRDDIAGFHLGDEEMTIEVGRGLSVGSNSAGQSFGINVKPIQIHIVQKTKEEIKNTPLTADLLKVYPNPTQDLLNLHLNGGQEFESVVVYNLTGQVVYNVNGLQTNRAQINVSNLQDGLYIVSLKGAKGTVNKKFEVIR